MTTTEYDNTPFEEHHRPTGIRLIRPEPVPHTFPIGPWTFRSGPGASWAAELTIEYVRASLHARTLGVPYNGLRDSERFRREFGQLHKFTWVEPVGPGGPVLWDAALVEIFATLSFMLHDAGGFRRGEPAFPDRIELNAPQLPADLRGTVAINKYGQAWS